ncbi:MAG: hypothetical protein A4E61_01094 [Syntrophorhabdus sp. PtaB.Bin184]|jgi:hypothetical protein|nr:MAG: hypothetical protein A4E61_01094 [Syntrophorhabdus sp. PtaB.Bin184]
MENIIVKRKAVTKIRPAVMERVIQLIQQISYGEIVITIHDSKVVQIEKREKTRFQD